MSGPTEREGSTLFDNLIALRDRQRREQSDAVKVIHGDDVPVEVNSHGIMRWYLHPSMDGLATRALIYFVQEIPPGSSSGKQQNQGDVVHYILEGEGYTEIDGEIQRWSSGDVVVLPLKSEGVVFQHVNTSRTQTARLISVQANLVDVLGVDLGSGFEELEPAPEYVSQLGD
ncbi:MAG: cupin domain-containing protein [Chloroflexi bacterium]|nr:cupin domain-containing protein [Chloroflexota bacterium]